MPEPEDGHRRSEPSGRPPSGGGGAGGGRSAQRGAGRRDGDAGGARGALGRSPRGAQDARRAGGSGTAPRRSGEGGTTRERRGDGPARERRAPDPGLPDEVTGEELDRTVRRALVSLSDEGAVATARHLVMAGRLLDDDPEAAYAHASAARRRAPRLAETREALGLAAYASGRYAEALAELRAARRISGSAEHLPIMADCERGLGRPERALELAGDPAVSRLERAGQVEMRIVAAGARRDLGQVEAAVVALRDSELTARPARPETVRLRFAYADALLAAGRAEEAAEWFARAAEDDSWGETAAAERLAELQGVDPPSSIEVLDVLSEDDDGDAPAEARRD